MCSWRTENENCFFLVHAVAVILPYHFWIPNAVGAEMLCSTRREKKTGHDRTQEALGRARKSVKPEDIEQYKSFAKNLKVINFSYFFVMSYLRSMRQLLLRMTASGDAWTDIEQKFKPAVPCLGGPSR